MCELQVGRADLGVCGDREIGRRAVLSDPNPRICAQAIHRKFPAAANSAANFLTPSAEFCQFCPKTADSADRAGKGAVNLGNLLAN